MIHFKKHRTILVWGSCLIGFALPAFAAPQMKPIVSKAKPKAKVGPKGGTSHRASSTKPTKKAASKKKPSTSKKPQKKPQKQENAVDLTQLKRLEAQILQIRSDRHRWEEHKQGLLATFANYQSAFAATLPDAAHSQPNPVLLALSSQSMADFVHNRMILNYLEDYRVQHNLVYVNLRNNLQKANFAIQSCQQTEQQLLQLWNVERMNLKKKHRS